MKRNQNCNKIKKKHFTIMFFIIAAFSIGYGILHYIPSIPLDIFTIQAKPQQSPQKIYDYYIVIDKDTGESLMYVPLIVTIGDQLISENNKYYVIVEIKDNIAYAKTIENTGKNKAKGSVKK